jgi:hypothetical protein
MNRSHRRHRYPRHLREAYQDKLMARALPHLTEMQWRARADHLAASMVAASMVSYQMIGGQRSEGV